MRECEKNEEMGGSFFKTEEEAKAHIKTLTRDNMKMWLEEITTAILLGGLLYLTIIVMFTLI